MTPEQLLNGHHRGNPHNKEEKPKRETPKYSKLRPDWTLPKGDQSYPETQPQIAQLELFYSGPLVKDSMVERFEDLMKLKNKFHYQHKRVWVKELATEFYLDNGEGREADNWKRAIARMQVQQWNEQDQYQAGDVVVANMKMYYALKDVGSNISPLSNEDFWGVMTGEIETYRYIFNEATSVIVYTEIKNPTFQIIKGEYVLDSSGENVIDEETGFLKMENQEFIDAQVIFREDLKPKNGEHLPDNEGGNPYEIKFFENEQPVKLSGAINVK